MPPGSEADATTPKSDGLARFSERTGANYGLAIAAFPPAGAVEHTAAAGRRESVERSGTLQVALATGDNVKVKGFPLASHPSITKQRAAKQALNMLRLAMLNRA